MQIIKSFQLYVEEFAHNPLNDRAGWKWVHAPSLRKAVASVESDAAFTRRAIYVRADEKANIHDLPHYKN